MSLRLESIQLRNLRSLKDTGQIKLKPITVLVGKNSVGKSTFLRSFPLLRQSCEKHKRAPILWYGKLVDFGDFKTAINRSILKKEENFIGFNFNFSILAKSNSLVSKVNFDRLKINNDFIDLSIKVKNKEEKTYISSLVINVDRKKVVFNFDLKRNYSRLDRIIVDNVLLFKQSEDESNVDVYPNSFLPRLEVDIFDVDDSFFEDEFLAHSDIEKISFVVLYEYLKSVLVEKYNVMPSQDINKLKEFVVYLTRNKKNIESDDVLSNIILKYLINSNLMGFFEDLYKDNSLVKNILNIFKLDEYVGLIDEMDLSLNSFYSSVRYLEPLRATAQRYYRAQELSINEIDSKGSNVPMFLDNLSSYELGRLKEFISKHFSIDVGVKKEGGHLALTIIDPELGIETNIADLGVGYSQLLPFLVQFWDLFLKARMSERLYLNNHYRRAGSEQKKMLLIEQPELHLHPAYQAKVVDMIVELVTSLKSKSLGIILETHSPQIIYRLSELVESGELAKDDVQILVFEEKDGSTIITETNFDDDGDLINWPSGFFQV
ncbi:hypothetical protein Acal02_01027 [Acinetobacter calcoaceticus]